MSRSAPGFVSRNLAYLILAPVMLLPVVVRSPYFVHVLILGGIYAILAIGQNLVTGYCGQIHLGMAGFYGIGAYTSAVLTTQFGFRFWSALPAALALSAIAGLVVGIPALKVRGGVYLVLVTVSFAGIVQVCLNQWVAVTKGPMGIVGIPPPSIVGFDVDGLTCWFYLTYSALLLVTAAALQLVRSRIGRSFVAVRESEVSAQSIGINPAFYKVLAFVLSAVLAGLAGSIYAHYMSTVSPDVFGFSLSVVVLVMIVVGGVASIPGSIVGGIALAILPELLRAFGAGQMVLYGLIVVLATVFLPTGLLDLGLSSLDLLSRALGRGAREDQPHA